MCVCERERGGRERENNCKKERGKKTKRWHQMREWDSQTREREREKLEGIDKKWPKDDKRERMKQT